MDFNKFLPLAQASSLPSEAYVSNFGNHFLHQTWQYIGPRDLVKQQNAFITRTIDGNPLVFVYDDNQIKGYHNVCRHKGSKIAKGNPTSPTMLQHCKFVCPYHGWTYDLDGKLLGVTDFAGVEDFCKEDNTLPSVRVDTFGQFFFVCESEGNTLQETLAPLGDTVPTNFVFVSRKTYKINCNWKVFVDNFLDGCYHCGFVHKGLVSSIDNTKYKIEVYDRAVLQTAPMIESDDPIIKKTRHGTAVYYWWLFPNTMINVYGSMMDVNVVYPLTDTTCEVVIDFYRSPSLDDQILINESIEVTHQVQVEDVEACEMVQEGMTSSSFNQGRYSVKREAGIYRFHQLLT